MESLVTERDNKLVALIYPDVEAMQTAGCTTDQLPHVFREYIRELNHHIPKYMRVSDFEVVSTEFEKTPKRSIKRFLYK